MEPARLGKYELVRHLASGGMASVYLARLSGLGGFERHVVLKTLRAAADDDGLVPMFLDEARLVATLHHQHIAQVFEVGCDDSTYFLAMEYVHGETVRHVMETMRQRGRSLPLDFCLTVVAAAAAGLHHAHERRAVNGEPLGIVHRDVTPSNVIASYDGSIKLIDFGIAKAAVRATVTRSGLIKGKVGYMAPEQVRGYPIDRRSDVFALGVLTYELTTQSRAFDGASQFEQLERTARGEITPPSHIVAGYPKSLEKIVLKALEVDPDDRYADTQAMRAELVRVARELGLALGEAAVIRVLVDLFGSRPEPWMVRSAGADDPIEVIETPPIEIVRPFLRARGTGADGADDADGGDGDDDDEITTHPIDLVETRDFVKLEADTPPPASSPPSPIPLPAPPPLPVSIASGASSAASRVTAAAPPFVAPSLPAAPSSVRATATRAATTPPAPPLPLAATPPLPPLAAAPPLPPLAATPPPPPAAVPVLVPSRQRHWLVAGSILLALGAITAVVIAFANTHDVAPATTTTTTTSGTTVPAPPVVPAPAVPAPAKPTPPPARRADRVMLEVTTDPPDATVVLDGVRLGRTPYRGEVAVKEGGAWLKVRKKRYVPIKQRVALDHDVTWHVELRARARD